MEYIDAFYSGLINVLPFSNQGQQAFFFMMVGVFIGFWVGILPGAAIFVTALSVTMIGQGLDAKKTRRRAIAQGTTGAPTDAPATRTTIDEGKTP